MHWPAPRLNCAGGAGARRMEEVENIAAHEAVQVADPQGIHDQQRGGAVGVVVGVADLADEPHGEMPVAVQDEDGRGRVAAKEFG